MIRFAFRMCLYAAALGGGAMLAWAVFRPSIDGSGVPATEERKVGDVSEVVLSGGGDLTIVQGEVPSLSVTADDNILPHVETETRGRRLTLGTRSAYTLNPRTRITYTLTVPRVEAITVSGAGTVTTQKLTADKLTVRLSGAGNAKLHNLDCKAVSLTLSGASNATVGGKAEKVTAKLSGAGDIDAAALKAATADVHISGAGTAKVWAADELKARVSGAGAVRYKGSPSVSQKVSGAGSVKPLPAEK